MRARRVAAGAALVAGVLALACWQEEESAAASSRAPRAEALACRFEPSESAAFVFASSATLDGPERAADRVEGVLSWVVVDGGEDGALLRASLSDVEVEQALSEDRVRASELEDGAFYVRVDRSCRFTELGFSPRWSAESRRLVATLFAGFEIALPGDASTRWDAEQRDGVGEYSARYEARGGRIVRSKEGYRLGEAERMGVRVELFGARATARFDRARPGWMERVEGRERVRVDVAGRAPEAFVHRFRIERADERFVAVSDALAVDDADFTDVLAADYEAPAQADPALAALDREGARERFLGFFGEHADVHAAARFLAAWLRAHPEKAAGMLTELRDGAIDEVAHSAFFLALELAGTDESRDALATALVDERLAEVDRARAATALADHGEPTRASAELLLAQAREPGSPMVASVSLLGAGSMAARVSAGDPLREELLGALGEELERVEGQAGEIVAVDAIANSRDDAFAPALAERLGAERPSLRSHAAEALGHLSPEVARPALTARLAEETSPSVSTALVRSLRRMGAELEPAELAFARARLAASPSAEERAALIDWLGASAQLDARRVLASHFGEEPSVHLQQRIGAYLSSRELRELAL